MSMSSNGKATSARRRLNLRRAHKKSHLGCQNCKQRRIKCNEQLPICGQCSKSKLKCSYLSLSESEIQLRKQASAPPLGSSAPPIALPSSSSHHIAIQYPAYQGPPPPVQQPHLYGLPPGHGPGPGPVPGPAPAHAPAHGHGPAQLHAPGSSGLVPGPAPGQQQHAAHEMIRPISLPLPLHHPPGQGPGAPGGGPPGPPGPMRRLPHSMGPPTPTHQSTPQPLSQQPLNQAPLNQSPLNHSPLSSQSPLSQPSPISQRPPQAPPQAPQQQPQSQPPHNSPSHPVVVPSVAAANTPAGTQSAPALTKYYEPFSVSLPPITQLEGSHHRTSSQPAIERPAPIPSPPNQMSKSAPPNPSSASSSPTAHTGQSENTAHNCNNIRLPSITQSVVLPAIDNLSLMTSRLPLFRQGMESDLIKTAYMDWLRWMMVNTFNNSSLYHAVMALSYGQLASKTGHEWYKSSADKHKFIALHALQAVQAGSSSSSSADADPDSFMAVTVVLSWNVFYQDDDMVTFVTLAKGIAAMLERMQASASMTAQAAGMGIAVIQGVKSAHVPAYDMEFFYELASKVRDLESFVRSSGDNELVHSHFGLVNYVNRVLEFLRTSHRTIRATWSGTTYFSPKHMFHFLRDWYKLLPSSAMSTLRKSTPLSEQAVVLFAYFHCVTRALEALFPEVRYIFQFGFAGPTELALPDTLFAGHESKPADSYRYLSYPFKVLMFFKERLYIINRILGNSGVCDPPVIRETFVKSFASSALGPDNYPSTNEAHHFKDADPDQTFHGQKSWEEVYKHYFNDRVEILQNIEV